MNIDDGDMEISELLPAEADCLLISAREDASLWSREERAHMNMGGGGYVNKVGKNPSTGQFPHSL